MFEYPLRFPAIPVHQPLGLFYITAIPAQVLLETCFSERLRAERASDSDGYILAGTQRELQTKRLREIGAYISTPEAAFPNSIILAANFRHEDGTVEEDEGLRWRVDRKDEAAGVEVVIPSSRKLAAVIDGQHRLFGFSYAELSRLSTELVCSVFFDLPKPFQAFLFATINSTQKSVDRSQTYELFGYNVDNEPPNHWSPDKLAVFLARKLNSDHDSPIEGRILIAAENDLVLNRTEARRQGRWMVSMATVVDGIVRLISRNPREDGFRLLREPSRNRSVLAERADNSPLRPFYLDSNDKIIYLAVLNYLRAVNECLWKEARAESFITKTIGVQALFDILRSLSKMALKSKDFSAEFFASYLRRASTVDFADEFFANPSGSGRVQIRRFLWVCLGLPEAEGVTQTEKARFSQLYKAV